MTSTPSWMRIMCTQHSGGDSQAVYSCYLSIDDTSSSSSHRQVFSMSVLAVLVSFVAMVNAAPPPARTLCLLLKTVSKPRLGI